MKQFTTISSLTTYLEEPISKGLTIGFVPTMGALHPGHLNLVKRSKLENDLTVCSIFVNPIQFNNASDLAQYPRTLELDLKLLENIRCDVVFTPEGTEMYPEGQENTLDIDFGTLDKVMEGKFRPGHFKGVAIVVEKLLSIVKPSRAYFGKKDYQQLAIIKFMVDKTGMPVKIVPCETIREPDGLAMSSRNVRLTAAERNLAPSIYQALVAVKEQAGQQPIGILKEWAIDKIQENSAMKIEYFEIGDKETLMPVENWDHLDRSVAFIALFLGDVRLIDNIELFS